MIEQEDGVVVERREQDWNLLASGPWMADGNDGLGLFADIIHFSFL